MSSCRYINIGHHWHRSPANKIELAGLADRSAEANSFISTFYPYFSTIFEFLLVVTPTINNNRKLIFSNNILIFSHVRPIIEWFKYFKAIYGFTVKKEDYCPSMCICSISINNILTLINIIINNGILTLRSTVR